jgi:AcrR family transcriptional regulator
VPPATDRPAAREQRERILRAALAVAGRYGYRESTIDAILERSGTSAEEFARQFRSLEDCLLAAWDRLAGECVNRFRRAAEGPGPWSDRLRQALSESLRWVDAHPGEARFLLADPLAVGGPLDRRRAAMVSELAGLLDSGRAEMEDPDLLPASIAEWTVGGLYDLVYRRVALREDGRLIDLLPDLLYFAAVPYLGPQGARAPLR